MGFPGEPEAANEQISVISARTGMSRVHNLSSGPLPASQGFLGARLGVLPGVRTIPTSKGWRRGR